MPKDPAKQFHDPASPLFWFWRDKKYCPAWFGKAWHEKTDSQRDRELAAFRYELARRGNPQHLKRFGWPYPKANPLERDWLAPHTVPLPALMVGKFKQTGRRQKYIELPEPITGFWSETSLGTVMEKIKELIKSTCRERGIKLPKGPRGKQNRPPSWEWLELLDRKDILGEKFVDESQRAKLAAARDEAERCWRLYCEIQAVETA